jgi:hypothetical protein
VSFCSFTRDPNGLGVKQKWLTLDRRVCWLLVEEEGRKRLWREEIFGAGAAGVVVEVFEPSSQQKRPDSVICYAPLPLAASWPLSARFGASERPKGQLAHHHQRLAGSVSIPATT